METQADQYAFQLRSDMLEAARAGRESDVARLFALDPSLVDTRPAGWYPCCDKRP